MNNRIRLCLLASFILVMGCNDGGSSCEDEGNCDTPTCTFPETRCDGGIKQTCDANGTWQNTPCPEQYICSNAAGAAECVPQSVQKCTIGAMRCNGSSFEKCDGTTWNPETCDGTCVEINGIAACQPGVLCTAGATKCNGEVLEKCDGTAWIEQDCNGTCVVDSGMAQCKPNEPACSIDTTRCNGATLEKCDGTTWNAQECDGTCDDTTGTALCNTDDTCTEGETKCNDDSFEKCDGTTWIPQDCNGSCVVEDGEAKCKVTDTVCQAEATRCNGASLEKCNGTAWIAQECDGICSDSTGQATCQLSSHCRQDETKCNGETLEKCDGTSWVPLECNGTCVTNDGKAECQICQPGTSKCNGQTIEKCDDGTQWTSDACAGTCVEKDGTASCFIAECAKDETECHDDGTTAVLWTCSDDFKWIKTTCPASDVEGARLSCQNANSCSTYLCGAGMVFHSEEKYCMSSPNDCTLGRTYCNGKTNYLYECLASGSTAPSAATDCTKDGKVCVKLSDDEARCEVEECKANICEGETLIFCTSTHKFDPNVIDCTASERICDLDENGSAACMYPECIEENSIRCVAGDETHTKYEQCINKRWSEIKTCATGTQCEKIGNASYCAECHADDEKCEEVDSKATHFSCTEQFTWQKAECPEATPVCSEDHKTCTEKPDECGNAHVGAGEDCDGTDLGSAADKSGDEACKLATGDTNATGTLGCYAKTDENACHFDTSNCQFCGNNTIETIIGEECDGNAEITKTCAELIPNTEGTVKCADNCKFDTSECILNYTKIAAIYKDYDRYVNVVDNTTCKAQSDAPKATVSITGVVTAIHPDKTGFYIQACDEDDTRGIFVYVESSINMPKDIVIGNVYSIKGGLVSNYQCGVQIKKGDGLTFSPADKACKADPQDVKISDILAGPKGNYFGSLVNVKGEKAIAFRTTSSYSDNTELNVPGGEKGWRLGNPGIGSEITVSSYLFKVVETAMATAAKYNVTGIVVQNNYHMGIAPRSKDDIVANECVAICENGNIQACNGDILSDTPVTCAENLGFDGNNGTAVCSENNDGCKIDCDMSYVLAGSKCIKGFIETFNYTGNTTLSNTTSNAAYSTDSFTSEDTGLTWNYENVRNAMCFSPIDGNGIMFKDGGGKLTTTITGGISNITLQARRGSSSDKTRTLKVEVQSVTDETKKVNCSDFSIRNNEVVYMPSCEVKIAGDVKLTITTTGKPTNIDNVQWLSYTE